MHYFILWYNLFSVNTPSSWRPHLLQQISQKNFCFYKNGNVNQPCTSVFNIFTQKWRGVAVSHKLHMLQVISTKMGRVPASSSPLCLHSSSYLTVFVLSCLLAASSSAPLPQRRLQQRVSALPSPVVTAVNQSDLVTVSRLILRWSIEGVFPHQPSNSLLTEVRIK